MDFYGYVPRNFKTLVKNSEIYCGNSSSIRYSKHSLLIRGLEMKNDRKSFETLLKFIILGAKFETLDQTLSVAPSLLTLQFFFFVPDLTKADRVWII